jgi:hypothetical protein
MTFKWDHQWLIKEVEATMASRMKTAVAFLRTGVVKSISISSRAGGPSQPGQPPHADTGHLRQSIFGSSSKEKGSIVGTVGTTAYYGRALEFGATIRPVQAKALTIPISPAAKRCPARKFPRKLVMIWPKGSSHGYLVEQMAKKTVIHYVLAKSVTLKARPYLRPGLNTHWKQIKSILQTGTP